METLKKIVTNQYFPAGSVLAAVLLFWVVGLFGGLSLLNNNQPPLTTLTWLLFVYSAAVLSPVAGIIAGVSLVRRWRRNRAAASEPRAAAPEPRTSAGAGVSGQQPASDSAATPPPAAAGSAAPGAAAAPSGSAQQSRPPMPAKKPRQSGREAA